MSPRELLRLESIPVYQHKMFGSLAAAHACPRGDLLLAQDEETGLVSNIAFDPGKLEYDESYQNEQGHSSAFQSHLSEVLGTLSRHFRSSRILEIGCGKGAFLEQLRQDGYDAWGVDPAYEGESPFVIKAAFEASLNLCGDAIVMRHVLEHIPQPLAFLETVRQANQNQGMIYIEVPCLNWILDKRAWFDFCYEHVNYFRLTDFSRLFGVVHESGHLFGGQYLYAIADLATLRDPSHAGAREQVDVPADFFAGIDRCLTNSTTASQRVVWGGGAKGVMFSHHSEARGLALDFAIDISPAKQGKFLAVSGLPVLSPNEGLARLDPGAVIFVMNSNYLAEIQAMAGPSLNYISVDII